MGTLSCKGRPSPEWRGPSASDCTAMDTGSGPMAANGTRNRLLMGAWSKNDMLWGAKTTHSLPNLGDRE
jgi:hypothetical protein